MITEKYVAGILIAFAIYVLTRLFFKQQKQLFAYQKEIQKVLTDKRYKVKSKDE